MVSRDDPEAVGVVHWEILDASPCSGRCRIIHVINEARRRGETVDMAVTFALAFVFLAWSRGLACTARYFATIPCC